ncbi:hypothetical protein ES707_18329 [subsurface metagenome]
MAYINDEKTAQIRNALAVILRASFDSKQQDRLEDIARQVGRIGGLLSQKKILRRLGPDRCLRPSPHRRES